MRFGLRSFEYRCFFMIYKAATSRMNKYGKTTRRLCFFDIRTHILLRRCCAMSSEKEAFKRAWWSAVMLRPSYWLHLLMRLGVTGQCRSVAYFGNNCEESVSNGILLCSACDNVTCFTLLMLIQRRFLRVWEYFIISCGLFNRDFWFLKIASSKKICDRWFPKMSSQLDTFHCLLYYKK
jgi:hypothetical protein